MANFLHRKELSSLKQWLSRANRKPLVIRGARQVGKSTLARQLAVEAGLALIEINFERNPEYREAFASNNPAEITSMLGLLAGQKIEPGKTLLFLDEVQAAAQVLPTLRYFYEEMPALAVVAAGSLLEFTLADAPFSMPVGRVEYFYLGTMGFADFARALGQGGLVDYLCKLSLDDIRQQSLPNAIHQKCLSLLRQYWVVGGMPEAIATFAATQDYLEVSRVQQSIIATYRDDFNKYSSGKRHELVRLVFDRLPLMVGRKFKYANISRDYRSADIEAALQQLCLARIATKVHHSSANGVPLGAEENANYFKTLCLDVGLQCAALKLNLLDLTKDDLTLVNNGDLAEQFIGQHLLFAVPTFQEPALFYWAREAKSAAAEVDYLLTQGQQIIPVEVKAGTSGTLKSLHQFLKEKNRTLALRFNADTPSLLDDSKTLTDGRVVDYQLLSLPLYLVEQSERFLSELAVA